jgi:hypothetical protein
LQANQCTGENHFSQSDALDLRLVSMPSFITFGPGPDFHLSDWELIATPCTPTNKVFK